MNMKTLIKAIALSTCCALSTLAIAESADTVHLGKEVSKEQVINLLSPNGVNGQPLTRGIRLKNQPAESLAAQTSAPRGLSLEVYFDFDSAELTAAAKAQLSPVGEALQSNELAELAFTLEGHTDAAGDDSYNLSLSEQRARAVMNFFVSEYSVEPARVIAQGRGESQLLDGDNSISGVYRRVSIIAE